MDESVYSVLVVEDSAAIRRKVSDLLAESRLGRFVLEEAEDLAGALALLEESHPDAVLLDLGLPDSAGMRTFNKVRVARPESAVVVLTADDSDATIMEALRGGAQEYLLKDEVTGPLLQRTLRYAIERNRLEEALMLRADFDALTGVYSRAKLLEVLEEALEAAEAKRRPLTVCLCDVDRLKQVNDAHGHRTGDEVLEGLGEILHDGLEGRGFAGRYGGDEFLLVFPDALADEVRPAVEAMRDAFAETAFPLESGGTLFVTTTFGLASTADGLVASRDLIRAADDVLYRGKKRPG